MIFKNLIGLNDELNNSTEIQDNVFANPNILNKKRYRITENLEGAIEYNKVMLKNIYSQCFLLVLIGKSIVKTMVISNYIRTNYIESDLFI